MIEQVWSQWTERERQAIPDFLIQTLRVWDGTIKEWIRSNISAWLSRIFGGNTQSVLEGIVSANRELQQSSDATTSPVPNISLAQLQTAAMRLIAEQCFINWFPAYLLAGQPANSAVSKAAKKKALPLPTLPPAVGPSSAGPTPAIEIPRPHRCQSNSPTHYHRIESCV